MKTTKSSRKAGYSMVEALIATSLSAVVLTAVLGSFVWIGKQCATSTKLAWSQREAMNTSMKLMTYIQNASRIKSIDEKTGQWVTLEFPDGKVCNLVYSNAVPLLRDGRMYLFRDGRSDLLVARGLTEIMDSDGFTTPVFLGSTNSSSLRVAYRVSEPTRKGTKSANDEAFAVSVRFGASLRNTDG